jgi:Zinc dependent phospholipase C
MYVILLVIGFILVPSFAFAWGPMTHMYLGNELLNCAPLLPAGILALLKKHKQDFLYGNLMADIIIGKKYLPDDKTSHSWDVGLKLLEQAKTWPERSFAYGYLGHLAADTVAHETLTDDLGNMGHTWMEMKADSLIDKKIYWLQTVKISKAVRKRSDLLLEHSLDRYIFSFKTNKRIYKSMVFLSFLNKKRRRGVDRKLIHELHEESIGRMLDLLQHGTDSEVLLKNPL